MSISLQPIISHHRRPDLTFYPNGRIDLSSNLVKQLSLQPNDVIAMSVDDEDNILLHRYIQAAERYNSTRYTGALYPSHLGQRSLRTNNISYYKYLNHRFPNLSPTIHTAIGSIIQHPLYGLCANIIPI